MRSVAIWSAGAESDRDRFDADQAMLCAVAVEGRAMMRVHHGPEPGLALGRYHRRSPLSDRVARRLTGGRAFVTGPGLHEITLVAPSADWLDAAGGRLGPERVLNRALRPLLGALRSAGIDAFYPGRDLVTVGGRALACAGFTLLPDGLLVVEQLLGGGSGLGSLRSLLSELDPEGVAAVDVRAFDDAFCLAESGLPPWGEAELVDALAAEAERCWQCTAETLRGPAPAVAAALGPSEAAYDAFLRERGPLAPGRVCAAALTMLGAVEMAASPSADGRLADVELTGDLIAPYATLDEIAAALEGAKPSAPLARRALAALLADPRHFVLGAPDFAELVGRLA